MLEREGPAVSRMLFLRICPICGTEMIEIGKEEHDSLIIEPPKYSIQKDIYYTYACKQCEKDTDEAVEVEKHDEKMCTWLLTAGCF